MQHDQKDALMALQEKHQDEHRRLELAWTQPQTIRKFDKRSSMLLQNRQREQYMLLCGQYEAADQMKRINLQNEKHEVTDRKQEMLSHFIAARNELISQQNREAACLKDEQDIGTKLMNETEKKEIDVRTKRLNATQRFLDEEKNFDNFVAKKYKRPATCIVPSTVMVSRDATEDLPPLPRGRYVPHSVQDMMIIRKRAIVTPLPLQPLAVRKYKTQKIVRASK